MVAYAGSIGSTQAHRFSHNNQAHRRQAQEMGGTRQFSKQQVQAEICKRSFFKFVQRFWPTVIAEAPVWNWHIKFICDELQEVAERVFKGQPKEYDLIINVPPGSTKSTIASIMYPAWCWTRMSSCRVIGGSHTHSLAVDFSRKGKLVIKSELYRQLFPEVELVDDQDTKSYYETKGRGDRHAVGMEANITGFHGHIILVDDPINPVGVRSEATILATNLWLRETLFTRKVSKKVSVVILIMQRLHEEDPTGMMLALQKKDPVNNRIRHICLPATISDLVAPKRCRLKYVDGLLDPIRISKKACQEAESQLGAFGYAGQYDQNPVPRTGGMFKVSMIILETPPTQWKKRYRYWDKAGTKDGDGAYTAGVLMGIDMLDRLWILDVIRGRWDSGERERIIKQTADADGHNVSVAVEQEPGSGGKESAQSTVKNLRGHTMRVDRPVGDKIARADPFSIQVNQGLVYAKKGAIWWDDYRNELQHFPASKYKDQTDSSSGCFAVLTTRTRVGALGAGKRKPALPDQYRRGY